MAGEDQNTGIYREQGGDAVGIKDGATLTVHAGGAINVEPGGSIVMDNAVMSRRFRIATADVNAGATLLPAVPGYKYRLVDCIAIAVGGNAATVDTVDIIGTVSTARKLVAFGQAQLTRSTVLRPGITGATVLADGASFTANDANTAITIGKTGSNLATATHVDVVITYALEAA